jgi:O-succinylbenzoic acid--CoA ligase
MPTFVSEKFWTGDKPVFIQNPRATIDAGDLLGRREAAGLVMFRTSGSSGAPKIVGLTREALLESARAVNAFLAVDKSDRWLRVLPVFHVGGFGMHARAWLSRTPIWADDGCWEPRWFASLCAEHRITLTSLVPAQVHDIVTAELRCPPSLRVVVVGGGKLDNQLWQRARDLGWPLLTSYGLTEAASQVATLRPGDEIPTELTLLDHWQTKLSPRSTLCLKGPALFSCYFVRRGGCEWTCQEATEWHDTADRVELGDIGGRQTLRFLGRCDRIVKILGELVDLDVLDVQLEEASVEAGANGQVRLAVEADDRRGHRLVLEHLAGVPAERVQAALNARLPAFVRIDSTREVPEIHHSPLGKPMA